jgi:predicted outer membrane repeat protein
VTNLLDSGDGSLRQAICDARSTTEDCTILFAVTGTISLANALPDLSTNVDIEGPGSDLLTVQRSPADGTPEFSVFSISDPATVTLSGLTIANGNATYGGGIFNNGGILTVNDSVLAGNSAWRGGGITNFGSLTVSNSTLAGNTATSKGGGIANFGPLVIDSSTLTNNAANTGGAIYNFDAAILTIRSSTLADNAADFGGGIAINGGIVTVANSTLAGNSATVGGGILNSFSGMLTITNSTVAGNSATEQGGGIATDGTVACRDSLFAGNTAIDGPDVFGSLNSQGHNLLGNTTGCDGYGSTDLLNVDPMLGPLQDNGGPTWTMALLPGSSAIDTGDNSDAPSWDQRGEGFSRIVNGIVDIGAFEVQGDGPRRPAASSGGASLVEAALVPSITMSSFMRISNAPSNVLSVSFYGGSRNRGDAGARAAVEPRLDPPQRPRWPVRWGRILRYSSLNHLTPGAFGLCQE